MNDTNFRSATKEDEDTDEDEEEGDNIDVATFDEEISSPLEDSLSTQRVTPNYVNIRRARPSTTTSRYDNNDKYENIIKFVSIYLSLYHELFRIENDVEEKEVEVEEERPTRRRRPFLSSK